LVFFQMALRNVARNWNRTGMIIVSMALASAMVTFTWTLSGGYGPGTDLPWRQLVGADIVIYPNRFVFGGPAEGDVSWEWRRLCPDQPSDVTLFHPSLAEGYLSPADAPAPVFDLAGPALPLDRLQEVEGVAAVVPARLLQAYLVSEDDKGTVTRTPVLLRGRDLTADTEAFGIPACVVEGRYFRPSQQDDWVALVNGPGLKGPAPRVGERLELEVPVIRGFTADGLPVVDHGRLRPYYFLKYGVVKLSLGSVNLRNELPPGQALDVRPGGAAPTWPVFIDTPEVWVPSGTFDRIYREVAGQSLRYAPELLVRVQDMSSAKVVASRLGALLPGRAVLTVPQEVGLSGIRYQASLTNLAPFTVRVSRVYYERTSLALDVRAELNAAAFVVAGFLIAANMYILVAQRRREIGVLKAIGAGAGDILVLFLTEALGYALVGSLLGFGAVRALTLLSLFSSPASLVEGSSLTFEALGVVTGLTTVTALAFGFLPAWSAAVTPSANLIGGG